MSTDTTDDRTYRAVYDEAAARLHELAQRFVLRLDSHDVAGLFTATGLGVLLNCEPDVRACEWLRRYADEIERTKGATLTMGRA